MQNTNDEKCHIIAVTIKNRTEIWNNTNMAYGIDYRKRAL